jgi:uncharacterized membrane protein (Fun14 family)
MKLNKYMTNLRAKIWASIIIVLILVLFFLAEPRQTGRIETNIDTIFYVVDSPTSETLAKVIIKKEEIIIQQWRSSDY